jgi:hypothetical protein
MPGAGIEPTFAKAPAGKLHGPKATGFKGGAPATYNAETRIC